MAKGIELLEGFAGTAALTRHALQRKPPRLVGFMGSKARLSQPILGALDIAPGSGLRSIAFVDAGPWGWVWPVLLNPAACRNVAQIFRRWHRQGLAGVELWRLLVAQPPPEDLPERAAGWLWLQGRSASGVPVWWEDAKLGSPTSRPAKQKGWRAPDHATGRTIRAPQTRAASGLVRPLTLATRLEALSGVVARWLALQDGSARGRAIGAEDGAWQHDGYGHLADLARQKGFTDRLRPDLIATRVDDLKGIRWPPVRVAHSELCAVDHEGWAAGCPGRRVVYLDPPYTPPPGARHPTGYGPNDPSWENILSEAERWRTVADVVAISHAVPLADYLGSGWFSYDLTPLGSGKPETLTLNLRASEAWEAMLRSARTLWQRKQGAAPAGEQLPLLGVA